MAGQIHRSLDSAASADRADLLAGRVPWYDNGSLSAERSISLGRAAELLELPWVDLRTRFRRLDVPVREAPADLSAAKSDVEVAETVEAAGAAGDLGGRCFVAPRPGRTAY